MHNASDTRLHTRKIREALKDALKRFLKYLQVKKLSSENQSKLRRQLYWTSLYVIYKKCK